MLQAPLKLPTMRTIPKAEHTIDSDAPACKLGPKSVQRQSSVAVGPASGLESQNGRELFVLLQVCLQTLCYSRHNITGTEMAEYLHYELAEILNPHFELDLCVFAKPFLRKTSTFRVNGWFIRWNQQKSNQRNKLNEKNLLLP